MLIFRTDLFAPDGWSRLERCVMLGLHASPRSAIRFCLSGKPRFRGYLKSRRIRTLTVAQWEQIPPGEISALIVDTGSWNETDLQMAAKCRNAGVPVLAVQDPGDPEISSVNWVLGGSLVENSHHAPPGFQWALLHPRYRHFHRVPRFYHRQIRNILIHLEDRLDYRGLKRLIDELSRHGYQLRIGPMPGIKKNLKRALTRAFPRIRWTGKAECMARPMMAADVVVLPPGAATFEAAVTGTPAMYLTSCDNEIRAALRLESLGLGRLIPCAMNAFSHDLFPILDRSCRKRMGEAGKTLVDGRGLFRTIDFLQREHIIAGMRGETGK